MEKYKTKIMKKIFSLVFIISALSSFTFGQTQTGAVVSVYTQGVKISPEMAESLLRIELTKSEKFNVFDKLDMLEILNEQQIDISNCFGKCILCLISSWIWIYKYIFIVMLYRF